MITNLRIQLIVIFLTIASLVLAADFILSYSAQQKQRLSASQTLSRHKSKLEALLYNHLYLADGLATYISIKPKLTQEEYAEFAAQLMIKNKIIRNIGAARNLVISHMYPMRGNEKAVGLDYRKIKTQKDAALRAISLNKVIIAGPLDLVQGGTGLVARQPVYFVNQQEEQEFWGLISTVINFDKFIQESGIEKTSNVKIALIGKDAKGPNGDIFFGQATEPNPDKVSQVISLPHGSWLIEATPTNPVQTLNFFPLLYLGGAMLFMFIARNTLLHHAQTREHSRLAVEVEKSNEQFKTFFEQHDAVMLQIDASSGRIINANKAAARFYGYPRTQLKAMSIRDINALSEEQIKKEMQSAKEEHRNYFIFPHKMSDGSIRTVEVHSSPMRTESDTLLFSVIHDITERVEAEQKLQLSSLVFENIQEGVMITDKNNRILAVNRAFTEITGYSIEETLGKDPGFLSSGVQSETFFEEMWKELLEKKHWRGEIVNKNKNGTHSSVRLTINVVEDAQEKVLNYLAVLSDITTQKESEETLHKLAHYDQLTGLPNRVMLTQRIESAIARSKRDDTRLAILFLDLDRFKMVNDSMGHDIGDELLQLLSNRLRKRIRESDTIARIGGDEFVILQESISHPDDAVILAEEVLNLLQSPFILTGNQEAFIGSSIGISLYPDDAKTVQDLIGNADAAMYKAKENGRNTYSFFTESLKSYAEQRLKINNELRRALNERQFELYYQPQFDFGQQKITSVEALLRWHHPNEGLLTPGSFIQIAEESSLINEIGLWVLQSSLMQAKQWQQKGINIKVAVNVSSRQLRQPDFAYEVSRLLTLYELPSEYIELELTESLLMESGSQAPETLNRLKELGVGLAIDDFGTGYSSLSYLKTFPINKLKIDRSFVSDLANNKNDREIVTAIIAMANSLGIDVTAEGVEEQAQAEVLASLGCNIFQGYGFGYPMPSDELPEIIRSPSKVVTALLPPPK